MNQTVNTIDVDYQEPNTEQVETTHDAIYAKMTEEDFRVAVDQQMDRARSYWNKFSYKTRQDINRKYWLGNQIVKSELRDDQEKWVENEIFTNIETIVPIATSRTPEVGVTPGYKNELTRTYSTDVKRSLQAEWEVYQAMQPLLSRGIRNHQMNFIGVFKLGYDPETDEFWTEEIVATDCVFSKDGSFFAQYIKDKTLGDLLDMFPNKEEEILETLGYGTQVTKELRASPVTYIEAWLDTVVGWKLNNLVLGIDDNPHFDHEGEEKQVGIDPTTQQPIMKKVYYNHFKKPKKPILFLRYYTTGIHLLDDTSLIEQAIGLQDWINKRKRQIGANADSTNGHWVSSGDFISQEEFDKIEGGIDEKIWLENGMPADGLVKITGQALPNYIYQDLLDSRAALDSLMGVNQATRGEKTNNDTLGQDIMQRQQNYGRIDGYVRDGVEEFAEDWYEYMYHLYMVYRKDETSIAVPEDSDVENENVLFSRERIPLVQKKNGDVVPVPMVLRVKQGSTLPEDEVAEYQKALNMKDILRPFDYFKKVGESNPRQLEKNLLMWMNDPFALYKDDQDIKEMLQRMSKPKDEPPKVNVSVKGESPQGTAILEGKGLLPQGSTQFAIQSQITQMMHKSPSPGKAPTAKPKAADEKAEAAMNERPQDMPDQKQRLVNAMTDMLRTGEADAIMNGGMQQQPMMS